MPLKSLPNKAPELTAFEGGYLVSPNGGWRSVRPVINMNLCVHCGQCYLYCPDGTISPELCLDYNFCKGCGICAKMCKRGAITMQKEADYA
ncbi:MAG TPA: pyruvate ferredoxin oxidoreductase [Ruminococcaceae bacterium]|nr:pyruvate ferredoxin oxidoreductase [Oscillospiraceae bacterium]